MLTPALAWENRIHRPHGPHLCEHSGRSPETSGPRRLMHRPPTLATVAEATPRHDGVSFVHGYSGPQRHPMVVAHFFDPASDAATLGPSRERTASVALGPPRYIADDRRNPGGQSARPGRQGSPQREPALTTGRQRGRVREDAVESSFGAGLIAAHCGRRGQV